MKAYNKENKNLSVLIPWMTKQDNVEFKAGQTQVRYRERTTDVLFYELSSKYFDKINLCLWIAVCHFDSSGMY